MYSHGLIVNLPEGTSTLSAVIHSMLHPRGQPSPSLSAREPRWLVVSGRTSAETNSSFYHVLPIRTSGVWRPASPVDPDYSELPMCLVLELPIEKIYTKPWNCINAISVRQYVNKMFIAIVRSINASVHIM